MTPAHTESVLETPTEPGAGSAEPDLPSATPRQSASARSRTPSTPSDEEATRLAVAVGRLARRLRATRDDLGHGSVSALSSIIRKEQVRPGDLSRIEGIAAPTVTRILADLERRGLIERKPDPADRRSSFVTATHAGRDLIQRARSETAGRAATLLAALDDDQRSRLSDALGVLEAMATITP